MHKLRFQHSIKTLCRVLRVNRSTYYKHFHSEPAPRTTENRQIRKRILHIYAAYDKRLGAYKTRTILERDYGIRVSAGRVYRLMWDIDLPKMSTDFKYLKKEETDRRTYATLNDIKLFVFSYIEGYYNSKRPHGSLGYLTPNAVEAAYWKQR